VESISERKLPELAELKERLRKEDKSERNTFIKVLCLSAAKGMVITMAKRGQGEGTIRKRKDGSWEARLTAGFTHEGKQKQISKYFKSREDAKNWLAKAVHEQATGRFVDPDKITLGQWLTRWLNDYKKPNRKQTTYENYETMVRCHIKPAIGHIPIQKLQAGDLQQLYNKLRPKQNCNTMTPRRKKVKAAYQFRKMFCESCEHTGKGRTKSGFSSARRTTTTTWFSARKTATSLTRKTFTGAIRGC